MFKEKLNKLLSAELLSNGFEIPTPLQAKCLSKINGGFDVIAIAPDGSGKSMLAVISALQKLNRAMDVPPRALILAATTEKVLAMKEQFEKLTRDIDLHVECAYVEGDIDDQNAAIYSGTDIVVGTPKRLLEIYFSKNLNMNYLKLFIIDDAELMIKHGFQGQVDRLGLSLPKCQHLIFTNELNEKVQKLISKFIVAPQIIEEKPAD
jgi:superfamily II DNA/RNA helicase